MGRGESGHEIYDIPGGEGAILLEGHDVAGFSPLDPKIASNRRAAPHGLSARSPDSFAPLSRAIVRILSRWLLSNLLDIGLRLA